MDTTQLKKLFDKHLSDISAYNPKTIAFSRKPKFKQTASNCRLYGSLNLTYFNTGIVVDGLEMEKIIDPIKDSQTGGNPRLAIAMICEHTKQNLHGYTLDFRKKVGGKYIEKKKYSSSDIDKNKIKLFAKLLLRGYVFGYSRIHSKDMENDLKTDDKIDKIISTEGKVGRHFKYEDGGHEIQNISLVE